MNDPTPRIASKIILPGTSGGSFISTLSWKDLCRLREAVFKYRMMTYPVELKTDAEADRIIESLGPIICERVIKKQVDQWFAREELRRGKHW